MYKYKNKSKIYLIFISWILFRKIFHSYFFTKLQACKRHDYPYFNRTNTFPHFKLLLASINTGKLILSSYFNITIFQVINNRK